MRSPVPCRKRRYAERCESRGAPVTIDDVASVLSDSGITMMRVNQAKCDDPGSDLPDATNVRPTPGSTKASCPAGSARQKDSFDDLELGEERNPAITVREVGGTTTMTVLNVRCTIDPLEKDAARQVAQLREAMGWL